MEKKEIEQKKPYEKPAIVTHRIFETNALVCGKCSNRNQISIGGACTRGQPAFS